MLKSTTNKPIVYVADTGEQKSCEAIAHELGVPLSFDAPKTDLYLRIDGTGVSLQNNGMTMQGDWSRMLPRLQPKKLKEELLVRAVKGKNPRNDLTIIDATAGMGEDALLLAAFGYTVTMYEKNPVIALLLQDTMRRAKQLPKLGEIVSRMQLIQADSLTALSMLSDNPDIIYLDPMFPQRQKSALVKKKFQLLHAIEEPCANEELLLQTAIHAHPHKIIIKRPVKGAYLAERKPDYSLEGKGIRFDCIVLP